MKKSAVMMLLFATALYSQIPYTFQVGTTAKSAEVNANLVYLMGRIDSLGKKMDTLKSRNDSLEKRLDEAELPIGTILAALAQMDTLNGIWILADGRTATTEYFQAMGQANVPDLRGLFLRGLNAGRIDGKQDPDGAGRTAGSYQADTLKNHSHNENLSTGYGGIYSGGSYGALNLQTGATGGLETRGRNSAVYWYVKVK